EGFEHLPRDHYLTALPHASDPLLSCGFRCHPFRLSDCQNLSSVCARVALVEAPTKFFKLAPEFRQFRFEPLETFVDRRNELRRRLRRGPFHFPGQQVHETRLLLARLPRESGDQGRGALP